MTERKVRAKRKANTRRIQAEKPTIRGNSEGASCAENGGEPSGLAVDEVVS
jgi:hypothetical protein